MAAEIKVIRTFNAIRVMFNGVLHLHIARDDLLGVQSWVRESQKPITCWSIEYTLRGGVITCDYDSEEKWRTILDQMATAL